jgi:hypothetical protein
MLPYYLEVRFTDGSDIVGLTRLQVSAHMKIPDIVGLTRLQASAPMKIPDTHFCLRLSRSQGRKEVRRIMSIVKSDYFIWNQIDDLAASAT